MRTITLNYFYFLWLILLLSHNTKADNPKLKKPLGNDNSELREIKYLFEVGAYFGIDVLNFHGSKQNFLNYSGLQGQVKFKKILLSADFLHFNRLVDDKQLMPSFFNNTFKISFGGTAALSLGYTDNTWTTNFSAKSYGSNPGNTSVKDSKGKSYFIADGLIKYKAPSFIFGYQFTIMEKMAAKNFQFETNDKDETRKPTFAPVYHVSGSIDLLFAPKVTTDSTFIYSPYGYYAPKELIVNTPLKTRHFGAQFKMMITTPYALGVYISMGMLPGVRTTDSDDKYGLSIRAGVLINLSIAK
jgi:hypothetical protein